MTQDAGSCGFPAVPRPKALAIRCPGAWEQVKKKGRDDDDSDDDEEDEMSDEDDGRRKKGRGRASPKNKKGSKVGQTGGA